MRDFKQHSDLSRLTFWKSFWLEKRKLLEYCCGEMGGAKPSRGAGMERDQTHHLQTEQILDSPSNILYEESKVKEG